MATLGGKYPFRGKVIELEEGDVIGHTNPKTGVDCCSCGQTPIDGSIRPIE